MNARSLQFLAEDIGVTGRTLDRKGKALYGIDIQGEGLEIGPSFAPLLPKREGFKIRIADHLSTAALKEKYRQRGVPTERIEEVDFDLSTGPLSALAGRDSFDYVIASHVVEHVPDFILFLSELWTVMRMGGAVSLIVPDKRFCFDHFRPVAGLATVIDAHLEKRNRLSPGAVTEGLLNYVFNLDDKRIWPVDAPRDYKFRYEHEISGRAMAKAVNNYMDCHVWTFTPLNLLLLVNDLSHLGFFCFQASGYFNTDTALGEFYITLKKTSRATVFDRPDLCRLAFQEACADRPIDAPAYFTSSQANRPDT